jgi:hypothetical protein
MIKLDEKLLRNSLDAYTPQFLFFLYLKKSKNK